jgi:hypothetical protein
MGFDAGKQARPGYHAFHLAQENLSAGLAFLAGVVEIGKGGLAGHDVYDEVVGMTLLSQIWRFVQRLKEQITKSLEEAKLPRPRRRTAHRLFESLQEIGYSGAYDSS